MKIALKPALSTAVSVIGVAAAGVLAFTVNSSVLGGAANVDPLGTTPTIASQVPADPSPDTSLAPTRNPSPAVAKANEVTDTLTTYQVGEAGSVVIDTASGTIQVVSIMPATGWAAEPIVLGGDGTAKVHFYSATQRLEFAARLSNGRIAVNVTSDPITQPEPGKPGYRDDDDHHDDDDDEHEHEHEDDHDEEHEDDD